MQKEGEKIEAEGPSVVREKKKKKTSFKKRGSDYILKKRLRVTIDLKTRT